MGLESELELEPNLELEPPIKSTSGRGVAHFFPCFSPSILFLLVLASKYGAGVGAGAGALAGSGAAHQKYIRKGCCTLFALFFSLYFVSSSSSLQIRQDSK